MGVSQAAIAFRSQQKDLDPQQVVSRLFGKRAELLEQRPASFDPRNPSDVAVHQYGDVWVISSDALTMPLLENSLSEVSELHRTVGSPAMIIPYCQYDSGGTYGYGFIEHGVLTRSRLYLFDSPVQEFGPLKPFEQRWESAAFYLEEDDCPEEERQKIYYLGDRQVEVPEHALPSRLSYAALTEFLGICPWESDLEPQSWLLCLHDHPVQVKPWWRFW